MCGGRTCACPLPIMKSNAREPGSSYPTGRSDVSTRWIGFHREWRGALVAIITVAALSACSHNNDPNAEPVPIPDPISLHVRNENFLDMNVAVVASGVSRRLGT